MANEDLKKLLEQAARIADKIEEVRRQHKQEGIDQIKTIMAELGITATDLGFYDVETLKHGKRGPRTFAPKAVHAPLPPMYRDPESGKTWSGRGKQPRWLEGKREDYLIKQAA